MVNWSQFEKLPGSAEDNFERLCRSLIQIHYAQFGLFAALANQPGVEFHLRLHSNCALGATGRWFGWQCRWYTLASGKALGTTRRKKIQEALKKTEKALPHLTDWILWTRYPLTKGDQEWFYALPTEMKLQLWTSEHAETLLSGEAEMLRRTYFGELLLTPAALVEQHKLAVAPVLRRWMPETHQQVDAERTLRRMLGEPGSWDDILTIANRLLTATSTIARESNSIKGLLATLIPPFMNSTRSLAQILRTIHSILTAGDLGLLRQELDARPTSIGRQLEEVPRRLRAARLACGLDATNALADAKDGVRLLHEVNNLLGTRLVAVLADAGGGKTQLSAQLTDSLPSRPAGILLHGKNLHSGKTIDEFAKAIVIQGNPVSSMEALLAALDAAGERARRRLPLVIDGLNEAEDPRDWRDPLAAMHVQLRRFPHVLAVCTLRTGSRRPVAAHRRAGEIEPVARMTFAQQALPDHVTQIEIRDFGDDTIEAIHKYFKHFRIHPGDEGLPFELLSHPLTLRIFCEVTNPDREKDVGSEAMPGSLTGLFDRYIDRAIERIGELAPRHHRYYAQDVRKVLTALGTKLWDLKDRELSEEEFRKEIDDDKRPWNESVVPLLEQEGIILRIPGNMPGRLNVIPVYDALGGHLIADALLTEHGRSRFEPWIKDSNTLQTLSGPYENCHPLADDIFRALAGLLPRRQHTQQLWQLLDEPLQSDALLMASKLEGAYLDQVTVHRIADCIRHSRPGSQDFLWRLKGTRATVAHPLNAHFLDSILRTMPLVDRDLLWTEWVRSNWERIQKEVSQREQYWKRVGVRTSADRLRAKWMMWLLTSTVRNFRDRVTRALYWFGRGNSEGLFEETEAASDISDPYVFERMMAASYGVAMALSCDSQQSAFRDTTLPIHARKLYELLFKGDAPARTTHLLIREYGRRIVELAADQKRKLFSPKELARTRPPYPDGGRISWQSIDDGADEIHGLQSPFRMDFENYTLGTLVSGRENYDFKHREYRKIRGQVLWRVHDLGWTPSRFRQIDELIQSEASYRYYSRTSNDHNKVDRYGKKYSWIAYFEVAGWLQDRGALPREEERTLEVDVDPSFPSPTPEFRLVSADFLGDPNCPTHNWVEKGPVADLRPYLRQPAILGNDGPWVALDGYVSQHDESRGRSLFAFLRAFLVPRRDGRSFKSFLTKQPWGGRWLPEKPESHSVFAGEIPWCKTFPDAHFTLFEFVLRERKVMVRRRRPVVSIEDEDGQDVTNALMPTVVSDTVDAGAETALSKSKSIRLVYRSRMMEVEELQRVTRKFRAVVPVHDMRWSGNKIDGIPISGVTLSKRLAHSAELVNLPQTHDLQTKDGVRATYGIAFHPHSFKNSEHFFFIRESILRELLREHSWIMVWAVWGERDLSYGQLERAQFNDKNVNEPRYMVFQSIHTYS